MAAIQIPKLINGGSPNFSLLASKVRHLPCNGLKVSERHDVVMMFTCTVCDTRSMKTACRESYEKEPGSVEEFLAACGEKVKIGSDDTLNLTLEDLAGKKNLDS